MATVVEYLGADLSGFSPNLRSMDPSEKAKICVKTGHTSVDVSPSVHIHGLFGVNVAQCDSLELPTGFVDRLGISNSNMEKLKSVSQYNQAYLFAKLARIYSLLERGDTVNASPATIQMFPNFVVVDKEADIPYGAYHVSNHFLTNWADFFVHILIGLQSGSIEMTSQPRQGVPARVYNLGGNRVRSNIYILRSDTLSLVNLSNARGGGQALTTANGPADLMRLSECASAQIKVILGNMLILGLLKEINYGLLLLSSCLGSYFTMSMFDQTGAPVQAFPTAYGTNVPVCPRVDHLLNLLTVPLSFQTIESQGLSIDVKAWFVLFWRARECDMLKLFTFPVNVGHSEFRGGSVKTTDARSDRQLWMRTVCKESEFGIRTNVCSLANHLMPTLNQVELRKTANGRVRYIEVYDIRSPRDFMELLAWGNVAARCFERNAGSWIRMNTVTAWGALPIGLQGLVLPQALPVLYQILMVTGSNVPAATRLNIRPGLINPFFLVGAAAASFAFSTQITFGQDSVDNMSTMVVSGFEYQRCRDYLADLDHWVRISSGVDNFKKERGKTRGDIRDHVSGTDASASTDSGATGSTSK